MQLSSILVLLPILVSGAFAAPLEARQSDTYGWSVAFFDDASCTGTADISTTAGDDVYFDCQAAGSGPYANGTFFGAKATADEYCHIKFFADTACATQVGDQTNGDASACIANPPSGIMAYSTNCYR